MAGPASGSPSGAPDATQRPMVSICAPVSEKSFA